MNEETTATSGEWAKFIVLVVIMLGTVLVIALLRPLIFGRIVPAVMGSGETTTITNPIVVEEEAPASNTSTPATETEETAQEEPEQAEEVITTSTETETEAAESADTTKTEPSPDKSTSVSTTRHTVQPGETLFAISRAYNVTVKDIVTANAIANPDRVAAGTILLIPLP